MNNKRLVKFSFEVEFDSSKFPYPLPKSSDYEYLVQYIVHTIQKNVINMFDGKGNDGARFINKVECYELINVLDGSENVECVDLARNGD